MKHTIAVPDHLITPESPTPDYLTGIASTDAFIDSFLIGRAVAERYELAYLLDVAGHVLTGWSKTPGGVVVQTGPQPNDHGPRVVTEVEGIRAWRCVDCERVMDQIASPSSATGQVRFWNVVAELVITKDHGLDVITTTTRQVPHFVLDSHVHGILDGDHAARIARSIVLTAASADEHVEAHVSIVPLTNNNPRY